MIEGLPPEIKRLYDKWEKDKSSKIFAALANGLRKMGFYDEALNIVNEGLLRNPDYPEGYLVLGRINFEKGDTQGAIEAFEKTVELDPYNSVAVRFLAESLESQGNMVKSLEYYKKLKDLDPFFEDIDKKIESLERRIGTREIPAQEISELEETPPEEPPLIPEEEKLFEFEEQEKKEEEKEKVEEKPLLLDEFKTEEVPPFLAEEGEKVSFLDELEKPSSEEVVPVAKEEKEAEEIPEIESAKIFEEQGFLAKALESYKKALEKYPENEEIKTKVHELEQKLKPAPESEFQKIEEELENEEEIVPPEVPEEAIKVFEEIEDLSPVEEIFEKKEEKLEPEETPALEEIVEDEEIKYSPHPFKLEESEEKEEVTDVVEEKKEEGLPISIEEELSEDILKVFTEEKTTAPVLPEEEVSESAEDISKGEIKEELEEVKEGRKEEFVSESIIEEETVEKPGEIAIEEIFEQTPDETIPYKPFYEIEVEIEKVEPEMPKPEAVSEEKPHLKKDELEALLERMHDEKRKEEAKKKEMEEKIIEEEKIKDEENYRTFIEWIEKLKK